MQNDFFKSTQILRIQELRDRRLELLTELNQTSQELAEVVRSGTSCSISLDQTVQLCRLPSGQHYIYKNGSFDQSRIPRISEFLPVDLNSLKEAIVHMEGL